MRLAHTAHSRFEAGGVEDPVALVAADVRVIPPALVKANGAHPSTVLAQVKLGRNPAIVRTKSFPRSVQSQSAVVAGESQTDQIILWCSSWCPDKSPITLAGGQFSAVRESAADFGRTNYSSKQYATMSCADIVRILPTHPQTAVSISSSICGTKTC